MSNSSGWWPVPIKDLLSGAVPGMQRPIESAKLWARWQEIVGSEIATHAEPVSLREGVLKIRATSPAWATELGYLADRIKDAVNGSLGGSVVARVEVTAGARSRPTTGSARDDRKAVSAAAGTSDRTDPPETAEEALVRAHAAWLKRRSADPRKWSAPPPKNP